MERTDDPVRDADHFNREMEERPNKSYLATINYRITIPITAKDSYEAGEIAESIEADLSNYIYQANGDYEVEEVDATGTSWNEVE